MADNEKATEVASKQIPAPIPFDALVIRTDIELGGERIRMVEAVMEFAPQFRDDENRERAYRSAMAKVSDALLIAMREAEWGTK